MKKNILRWIGLLLVIILLLGACDKNKKSGTEDASSKTAVNPGTSSEATAPQEGQEGTLVGSIKNTIAKEDYPVVDGSTATIPLSEALYRLATGASAEEAAANIVHTKTSNSYYRLMNREADLLIVYAPSEEVMKDIENSKTKLLMKPIGKDALVFMANASNPVQSLTKQQLVDIYSGKITNWKEVGGEDKPILAFQRPENSGSQTLMLKLVMGDTPMMTGPNVRSFETMAGILEAMANYSNEGNALGYSVFYYADNMYALPELRFMKVNQIEPSLQTIYDNTYPFINEFYAVIREDESSNSNARLLFDWLTGEEGQTLIRDLGYVPVSMKVKNTALEQTGLKQDRLPEGYRYIGTSYLRDGGFYVGTVTVYDQDWRAIRVFQNANSQKSGLVSEEELIPIGVNVFTDDGNFMLRYGLYDAKADKFILPVEYDAIGSFDEEKGYYMARKDDTYRFIDRNGKTLIADMKSVEGLAMAKTGNHYWMTRWNSERGTEVSTIYNSDFRIVNTVEKDYNNPKLYHEDGTVYYSKEMFLDKVLGLKDSDGYYELRSYTGDELLISVYHDGILYLLDQKLNVVEKRQEGNSYFNVFYDIYSDSAYDAEANRENGVFYDRTGKVIKGKKGDTYSSIVYDNYWRSGEEYEQILYGINKNRLNILNYETGEEVHIELKKDENPVVQYVYGDLIFVNLEGKKPKTRVYKGSQILHEWKGYLAIDYLNNPMNLKRCVLLTIYDEQFGNKALLIGNSGEILYQFDKKDSLIQIDDRYIQLDSGNYWGVMDYEGKYIVKTIRENISND